MYLSVCVCVSVCQAKRVSDHDRKEIEAGAQNRSQQNEQPAGISSGKSENDWVPMTSQLNRSTVPRLGFENVAENHFSTDMSGWAAVRKLI